MMPEQEKKIIGGFFEIHEMVACEEGQTVLQHWTGGRPYSGFANARSAFAALIATMPDATVWLPAFICSDIVDSSYARRIRFYPVLDGFEPDIAAIEPARNGDIVLFIAYFGFPQGRRTCDFIARRPDLTFVEDRAQALDTGDESAADFFLYSPRKLVGVADGGILVANRSNVLLPQPAEAVSDSIALWEPALLRYEDPDGNRNDSWYAANRGKEAAMGVTSAAMTRLSATLLSRMSLADLSRARIANWLALDSALHQWSALPSHPKAAPLGYILRIDEARRDAVLRALHAKNIFAAVHWRTLPVPSTEFPREEQWTRELITLPCDHRYDRADMKWIAACVTALMQ